MSNLPTLIVDKDWVAITRGSEGHRVIRIDDVLPSVLAVVNMSPPQWGTRELRVGDRVTLATLGASEYERALTLPFATATVANIEGIIGRGGIVDFYEVTVTDVKELEWQPTTTATSNESHQPTQPSGTGSTTQTGGSSEPKANGTNNDTNDAQPGMTTQITVVDGVDGLTPDMLRPDKFAKAREFKEAFSGKHVDETNREHH